ncbi:3-oxoadipate enol-lactonase [Pacificibacter maritimus]|uniref:3-oxoadipate enol-lactonase n=1 Tax=Pacificibacter maritimus TaxID=762213 RepID=A0A3N4UIF7_9RHOB|nr:3-oxoadipate enol-lactonase [Pacificibacter maritimus]RPE67019.1 3-oxoadipate enol-lactonase [Pacificibacter maritimus]
MQMILNAGVALHVLDTGPKDGAVVMFANSLGTDLRVWDALIAHLPADLRVVRFDKRGHGLSDCPDGPYAIEDLANDAAVIADTLGLKDITFVGLSIGGLIGHGLIAARPDLVKALVLMDTAAKIGTPEFWNDRISSMQATGIAPLAAGVMERWFAEKFRADALRVAPWQNMLSRTPLEGYLGCCAAIAGADFTETARAMTIPVLAMVGDEDGATPPELVQATAKLCGAEFHLIKDAGHLPCVEHPAQTAQLITDFLKRTA